MRKFEDGTPVYCVSDDVYFPITSIEVDFGYYSYNPEVPFTHRVSKNNKNLQYGIQFKVADGFIFLDKEEAIIQAFKNFDELISLRRNEMLKQILSLP